MINIKEIEQILDNVPDINFIPRKEKAGIEKCGELTKRTKTTTYAIGQVCRLSRDYDNNESVLLFYKQGIRAEKMKVEQIKPKKKPFWMEYFEL